METTVETFPLHCLKTPPIVQQSLDRWPGRWPPFLTLSLHVLRIGSFHLSDIHCSHSICCCGVESDSGNCSWTISSDAVPKTPHVVQPDGLACTRSVNLSHSVEQSLFNVSLLHVASALWPCIENVLQNHPVSLTIAQLHFVQLLLEATGAWWPAHTFPILHFASATPEL